MNVLVPVTITSAMLTASSIAEPAPDETEWVSGAAHSVGMVRIRAAVHRRFYCVKDHTGVTTPPEEDYTNVNWTDWGPTAKWAAFDGSVTDSSLTTTGTYSATLRPGWFNAIGVYAPQGAQIAVVAREGPGGAIYFNTTVDLLEPAIGEYEYDFGEVETLERVLISGLLPYPDPEVTITITGTVGEPVGAGHIVCGDLRSLIGDVLETGDIAGTEYGATVEPVTYSYVDQRVDGRVKVTHRPSTTDIRVRVVVPPALTNYALRTVRRLLDVPAGWIAAPDVEGFEGLHAFGIASGSLGYDSHGHRVFNLFVKGTT